MSALILDGDEDWCSKGYRLKKDRHKATDQTPDLQTLTLRDRKTVLAVTAKVNTEASVHTNRSDIRISLCKMGKVSVTLSAMNTWIREISIDIQLLIKTMNLLIQSAIFPTAWWILSMVYQRFQEKTTLLWGMGTWASTNSVI